MTLTGNFQIVMAMDVQATMLHGVVAGTILPTSLQTRCAAFAVADKIHSRSKKVEERNAQTLTGNLQILMVIHVMSTSSTGVADMILTTSFQ